MGCVVYEELSAKWNSLVNDSDKEPTNEGATLAAYFEMVEHRICCEVCKDEDVARGILQTRGWR
jgi:hypothetical protein